jgi:hypothetical protein|uniref:hypothetical protein n=1 Tax=Prevotella sp. TaxID=59823 RepID=UPI00206FD0F2|nr:MAG TPA: hypothetical protein [Caudoviricetes sp.]
MAREMKKRVAHFGLENSDAIDENERILEAGRQQRQENREKKGSGEAAANTVTASSAEVPATEKSTVSTKTSETERSTTITPVADQPATTSFSNDIAANMRKPKGKKTENGITIYVPMEYYERIALMKMRTGVPIKDLALQAVIEFLDRNKM